MKQLTTEAIRSENVDMSNGKDGEKPFGRKPKGSNMKSNSSWVKTVPNGKLKGEARWESGGLRLRVEANEMTKEEGDLILKKRFEGVEENGDILRESPNSG